MTHSEQDYEYAISGMRMSKGEVEKLEASVGKEPGNWLARVRLLNYYSTKLKDKTLAKYRVPHIIWLIRNMPDLSVRFGGWSYVYANDDPTGAKAVREAWVEALEKDPNNLKIIQNAVTSVQSADPQLAEQLLLRAKELEPSNPFWSGRLSQIYTMAKAARLENASCCEDVDVSAETAGSIRELEATIERHRNPAMKLQTMQILLATVSTARDPKKVEEVANKLLALANAHPDNLNYGQYVYQANFTMAQSAFAAGAYDDAIKYLLKASETPGSQELAMMGPDFEMARELWEHGKHEEIATYIRNCRRFWTNDLGASERWLKQIAQGQAPDFNKYEVNAKSAMKMLELGAKLFFNKRNQSLL